MSTQPYKQFVKTDSRGHKEIWEWQETPELREFREKQEALNKKS